jgi:hypothetical protein
MSEKPNNQSVTAEPCRCGSLERAASEPSCPVSFSESVNEYRIDDSRGGHLAIYHCFFCGGAAPKSKRAQLFATIPREEVERLAGLANGCATLDDVIRKFGKPDDDMDEGVGSITPEKDGKPPTVMYYRTLRYSNLSETAEVDFVDYGPSRGVRTSFHGKYIGKPK